MGMCITFPFFIRGDLDCSSRETNWPQFRVVVGDGRGMVSGPTGPNPLGSELPGLFQLSSSGSGPARYSRARPTRAQSAQLCSGRTNPGRAQPGPPQLSRAGSDLAELG